MADKKVTELTAITRVSGDDLLLVVNDPLGTPASRKVTLSNFFANVSVDQVYTAKSTFKANTTFSGTTATFSANVMIDGTNILNAVNDRMQVANTNLLVNDRMQVANTTLLVNDRMQVANVNLLVDDRLQVANASATYISLSTLQTEVAASTDFDDFKSRIAAL